MRTKPFQNLSEAFKYYRDNPDGSLPLSEVARASEFSIFMQKGLNTLLLKGYTEYVGVWQQIMSETTSDMLLEQYPNLGTVSTTTRRLPGGEFETLNFSSENVGILNQESGGILEIDRWMLENDQTKAIQARPQQMGKACAREKDVAAGAFYNDGDATTIYDAAYMFAAAASEHPNITGGSANTANCNDLALGALTQANLETALEALDLWRGLEGEILDINAVKLVVSSNQKFIAHRVLQSQFDTAATMGHVKNVVAGIVDLVVCKRFDNDEWYLLTDVPGNVAQIRRKPQLVKEADDAGTSFDNRIYRYRIDDAWAMGCADWRFGMKGN